jgi:hypothetical protein
VDGRRTDSEPGRDAIAPAAARGRDPEEVTSPDE